MAETGDELARTKWEISELRAQNLRAKERICSASARLRAAERAMESVQQQRLRLSEAKKLGGEHASRAHVPASGQANGSDALSAGAPPEGAASLEELVQRQRERLETLEGDVGELTSETEELKRRLADSLSEADALRRQLREDQEREAAARGGLEAEVRRLRAECEARQAVPAAPSVSPAPQQQQQPEKVIIMTSSSMRTLETEKGQPPEQSARAPGAPPALVTAPGAGALHSPRPLMTAPAVPVRQRSAGAGPVTRQQVPVSCSSLPVFRQVSNDLRALGSPQSPAADGGAFGVGKENCSGGPPPPAGQVFRRYSGNGGATSPRPAPGGAAAAAAGNMVGGGAAAPPLQPTGQPHGSSSSQVGHAGQLGQAPQGRSTPQRLVPSQAGADPRWGYQMPSGTMPTMATMPSGVLLQTASRAVV